MTSEHYFERARNLMPGGVNSPVRSFKHVGRNPVYFERGEGPYLYDVSGKRYTDFCLSFGPHLLGHSPKVVVDAVKAQADKAMSFGACHPNEVVLAEKILQRYPFFERVRLVNSGTEAAMTAARLVRGATGRSKIIQFEGCYHGHSDGFLAKAGSGVAMLAESSSRGVPQSVVAETLVARLDNLETVEALFKQYPDQIAAVVLEPVPANHGLWIPTREYLSKVMAMARDHGALVLFDEVITGFRLSASGACGYFDLKPDLVALGKIIGGGLPLAAIAGKKEILDHLAPQGSVYQAGTLSGNPLATAAGIAVLDEIERNDPYPALEFATTAFVEGLKQVLAPLAPVQVNRIASLFWISFAEKSDEFPAAISPESAAKYAEFFKEALDKGLYFSPSPYEVGFVSVAHTPEVLSQALEVIQSL